MDIRPITPDFSAAPQITVAEVAEVARRGFRTLVCNRPDGEEPGQPDFAEIEKAAREAGIAVHYMPISNAAGLTATKVDAMADLLATADRPVLAYCRSGTRSTLAWGMAMAAKDDPETLIRAAAAAGYDLAPLRPAMEARQATNRGPA